MISGLTLVLRTEDGQVTAEDVRPAVPTLQTSLLRRLIRLRLSARQLGSGVEDIEIRSARTAPSRKQEELFTVRGRDLQAGARAFAAIRARFGNESVTCAHAGDSHLPERSFQWEPMDKPVLPTARRAPSDTAGLPPVVRRILFSPSQCRQAPETEAVAGPFVVSGSWWGADGEDAPYCREYSYHHSSSGVTWLYVDRLTDLTWVQGTVD